jgi:hypothetical protein
MPAMPLLTQNHCHPVERGKEQLNELRIKEILRFCDVSDMGLIWHFFAAEAVPNCRNACWKDHFFSDHRMDSPGAISPLRATLRWQQSGS